MARTTKYESTFSRSSSFVGVFLLEPLDAAGRIDQLLLAGEERMAIRANFNADQLALEGRARFKHVAAGAMHLSRRGNRDGFLLS